MAASLERLRGLFSGPMRAFVSGRWRVHRSGPGTRLARTRRRGARAWVFQTRPKKDLEEIGCEVGRGRPVVDQGGSRRQIAGCDTASPRRRRLPGGNFRLGASLRCTRANVTGTGSQCAGCGDRWRHPTHRGCLHDQRLREYGRSGRRRDLSPARAGPEYVSYYDETKHLAHLEAEARMDGWGSSGDRPAGPGLWARRTSSAIGGLMRQAAAGALRALTFPDLGLNMVHVDDVASGICLAHDRGRLGESYVLGGEITTLGQLDRQGGAAAAGEAAAAGRHGPVLAAARGCRRCRHSPAAARAARICRSLSARATE